MDEIDGDAGFAIGIGAGGEAAANLCQDIAAQRRDMGEWRAGTHGGEICEQAIERGIADLDALGIGDGHDEAGAGQEMGGGLRFDHGGDASGGAAEEIGFGKDEIFAQLAKCEAAGDAGGEQAALGERAAGLEEAAGEIGQGGEAGDADDEIEAGGCEGEIVFVGDDCGGGFGGEREAGG